MTVKRFFHLVFKILQEKLKRGTCILLENNKGGWGAGPTKFFKPRATLTFVQHHWPAPLASTTGRDHWPALLTPLASSTGHHHLSAPLAGIIGQTPGNMFIHVADDEDHKLDSNTGQHHRAAPLASTIQIAGPQHHWAATPARSTSGHHHWPAPLASTIDGQQHWPSPLVNTPGWHHWPRPLATCSYTSMTMRPTSWTALLGSTTGQHRWPALFKPVARSTTGQKHRPATLVAIITGQHHWPTMLASKTG